MKNQLRIFLLLFFIVISSGNLLAQGFNSVHTPDGSFVIAVGDQGLVYRSSNGGTSWETYTVGAANLTSVTSFGNNFWIAASNGRIYKGDKTVPGSLSPYTVDPSVSINGINFVNASIGYACGSNGKIYKSNNGGTSWTLSNNGVTGTPQFNGINFWDINLGSAVGNGGVVYLTADGGNIWIQHNSATTNDLYKTRYFANAIAAVGSNGTLITKTGSGGFIPVVTKTWEDFKGVTGRNITEIRVCGGGGFIRNNKFTTPSFLNFEANPMMANLTDIYYLDSNTAYSVSSLNKAIIKTTNSGTTWSLTGGATITYGVTNTSSGAGLSGNGIGNGFAYHPTNRNVMYLCHGNKVFRSGNKGASWVQIATVSSGNACHSFFVSPLDTNMMIASMDASGGRVMKSTNYGSTWVQTYTGTLTSYGMPLEMDQNNPNVLYLAPDNAIMMKSTNFGSNWTNWSNRSFKSPCDIAIQYGNSNTMYLGDGVTSSGIGQFYRSTNGGVSWDSIHPSGSSEIPMIANTVMDTNLVFHTCWSSGGVWRSFNKFTNFTQIATTGSAWACDISRDDPTAFSYYTYGGGTGYVSTNSGSNFSTNVGALASVNAGMAYLNKGELLIQSSSAVYKANFTYNVTATPVVVTGVEENITSNVPDKYSLYQNYPNPFNPSTTIKYDLPAAGVVKINVFNEIGQIVAVIENGFKNAGTHEVTFNASELSSGLYFYKLETARETFTRKMLLIK